jgi:hypothetical protein
MSFVKSTPELKTDAHTETYMDRHPQEHTWNVSRPSIAFSSLSVFWTNSVSQLGSVLRSAQPCLIQAFTHRRQNVNHFPAFKEKKRKRKFQSAAFSFSLSRVWLGVKSWANFIKLLKHQTHLSAKSDDSEDHLAKPNFSL